MFWLGLLTATLPVPGYTCMYIQGGWAVLSILLALTLWLKGKMTFFHWVGLGFLAYAALSLAWAPFASTDGIWSLWKLVILALAFRLGSAEDGPVADAFPLAQLYKGVALGLGVSSVLCVFQWLGYHPVASGSGANAGLLFSTVALGATCVVAIVGLISERLWLWIPLCFPALYLSGSRGAWFALGLMAIVALTRRAWPALVLAVGCFFLFRISPSESDVIRLATWQAALGGLTPFGAGAGAFQSIYLQIKGQMFHAEFAHNDYLQLLYEYGIGALPLLWLAIRLASTQAKERYVLVATLFLALYSMPLHIPLVVLVAGVAAGQLSRYPVRLWSLRNSWRPDDSLPPQPQAWGNPVSL